MWSAALAAFASSVLAAGCLDPMVSDDATASVNIHPRGYPVPHVGDNADMQRQIRIADGLSDSDLAKNNNLVPLKNGFQTKSKVKYWDLGDAPQTGSMIYVFYRWHEDETFTPIEHPYLLDGIPGDPGWSPFHYVQRVVVTPAYHDEIFTSTEALNDAVELGLINPPESTNYFIDGPVTQPEVRLDNGTGKDATPTMEVYAHGYRVDMLPVGGAAHMRLMARANSIPRGDIFRITVGSKLSPNDAKNPLVFQSTQWFAAVRTVDCRVMQKDPAVEYNDESMLFTRSMTGALDAITSDVVSWTVGNSYNKHWPTAAP